MVRCCLQCQIFYATGDLQGIDIQRKLFLRVMTNRRYQHVKRIEKCFDIPNCSYDEPLSKHPVYYDIDCIQQDLHLTVCNEYDEDGREILVVNVTDSMRFLYNRTLIKWDKSIPISRLAISLYRLGGLLFKEVLTKHSFGWSDLRHDHVRFACAIILNHLTILLSLPFSKNSWLDSKPRLFVVHKEW